MSLRQFAKKNRELVIKLVNAIVALNPGYGDTINYFKIAESLGLDGNDRTNRMAFHAARDECIELTPSLCFKVKARSKGGQDGEFVRMTEEERGDKAVLRYMRKAKEAAYRGIRRGVRTKLPDNAPPDVKREHERRLVQASNIFHDIKTGLRTSKNGRWFGMQEASPDPRPTVRPVPSPEKPRASRWLGLDQPKDEEQEERDKKDKGEPPTQAPSAKK
jgi:hypothetical protein